MHDLQRYLQRIGKRIYRKPTSCKCNECAIVASEGLVIYDVLHAKELHSYSGETGVEYFDGNPSTCD